ncbi:MAG: acyl-CoA dehydrogenase family protein, partial [Pseudomonadota bacterium]
MSYQAPVADIVYALKTAAALPKLIKEGVYDGLDMDTVAAVMEEAGKFGSEVLEPLNWSGDQEGARLENGTVTVPKGFAEAYKQFAEGGWASLPAPEDFGGQALPETVSMAASEIWNATNMAFGLCPLLTQGAIDALLVGGSDDLKKRYLPKMVSGEWTGTMNLTEPHAGSDLSVLKSKAERADDGTYRIFG